MPSCRAGEQRASQPETLLSFFLFFFSLAKDSPSLFGPDSSASSNQTARHHLGSCTCTRRIRQPVTISAQVAEHSHFCHFVVAGLAADLFGLLHTPRVFVHLNISDPSTRPQSCLLLYYHVRKHVSAHRSLTSYRRKPCEINHKCSRVTHYGIGKSLPFRLPDLESELEVISSIPRNDGVVH